MKDSININISSFRNEWNKIEKKLQSIEAIEKPQGQGKEFTGVIIDNEGITYNSETFLQGCGTDQFSFEVKWDELNNPISYFEEKYRAEFRRVAEYKAEKDRHKAEKEKDEEYKAYLALKAKYDKNN